MKKKLTLYILCVCACAQSFAQIVPARPIDDEERQERKDARHEKAIEMMAQTQQKLKEFDTEALLDSLDQERLPKKVTGGVLLGGNFSNYIMHQEQQYASSHMMAGFDMGGFLHFQVTQHFAIQGELLFTTAQNLFQNDPNYSQYGYKLWSLGFNIPVYFMGQFGNMQKGYLRFGAGPYTHNVFASNLGRQELISEETDQKKYVSLFENHSGLQAILGYEFPLGILINFTYGISLSDVATFYATHEQASLDKVSMYPQKLALMVGYRFK